MNGRGGHQWPFQRRNVGFHLLQLALESRSCASPAAPSGSRAIGGTQQLKGMHALEAVHAIAQQTITTFVRVHLAVH